jgi:hypothetical protein
MADDVRLKLFLETDQASLREIKNEVERALSKARIKLKSDVSGVAGPRLSGPSGGALQNDIRQVFEELVDTGAKLAAAQEARAAALKKGVAEAKDGAEAAASLKAINEKHLATVKRLTNRYSNLNIALGGLRQIFDKSRDVFAQTAGRLASISPGGLESALLELEKMASAAASDFFFMSKSIGDSKAFEFATNALRASIYDSRLAFEQMGFKAEDSAKFLEIAMRNLVEEIGETDFKRVMEGDRRRLGTEGKNVIDSDALLGPGVSNTLPLQTRALASKSGLPLEKELEGLQRVARIKAKALDSALDATIVKVEDSGLILAQDVTKAGRGLRNAFNRILNESERAIGGLVLDKDGNIVRAEGALVSELYAQIQAIEKSIDTELAQNRVNVELVEAKFKMLASLNESVRGFQGLSRPIEPLTNRVQDLIFQFGSVPEVLRKFINSTFKLTQTEGETGFQLRELDTNLSSLSSELKKRVTEVADGLSIDQARFAIKKFGTNFEALANELIDIPNEVTEEEQTKAQQRRTALINALTNAYEAELNANREATKSASKLESARAKTSKTFATDATPVLDNELEGFREEVKEALNKMKGSGVGLARLGARASDFDSQLEVVKNDFIKSIDASKIAFFNVVEGGEVLGEALAKLATNFEKEFFGELKRIGAEQNREAERIAAIDRKIAKARQAILDEQENLLRSVQRNVVDVENRKETPLTRTELSSNIGDVATAIRPVLSQSKDTINSLITAALNPLRPAAGALASALNREAQDLQLSDDDLIKRAQAQYAAELEKARDAVRLQELILADTTAEAKELSDGYASSLETLRRQKAAIEASIKEIDDHQVFTSDDVGLKKAALREELDGIQSDIKFREKRLADQVSFKIAQGLAEQNIINAQKAVADATSKELEIQEKIEDLKRQEAKVIQDRITQELAARNKGARGALKRFSEGPDNQQGPDVRQQSSARNATSGQNLLNTVRNLFAKRQQELEKVELKTFADIEKVAKTLDPKGQEAFLKALKGEAVTLKEVNTLLKQHQGNIAKSSDLQQRLTANLTSSQKAAFDFGFAAANAAERLLAWASPAAFLFESIGLLREATTNIIKLDTELRKLVFFSPDFVALQISSIKGLDDAVKQRAFTDQQYAQTLVDTTNASTVMAAKNAALAASFNIVIDRSRDTGLALEDISTGLLAAARVGQSAFERNAQSGELMVSTFFRAAEAFKRLEGSAASTDTVVSLLNSTLNEYQLSAENAIAVTAAIADAAGKSALEGQELFDVLVRTGGAFNLLSGASVAESLAVIQRATEANIPSVSKLATAIRQFTTLAIENSDAIERFSGIKLIEAGQIKDMETFVSVLGKLNELAPAARNEFLSLFSERDTGATILALATRAKELNKDLVELGDANAAAGKAFSQTKRFLEQQLFQQEDLSSSINKLKAALATLVNDSGFVDFLRTTINGLTGAADAIGKFAGFVNNAAGVFTVLAGIAAPTVFQILKGFRAGFLTRQNSFKVEQEIIGALRTETGIHTAINKAETEGLITLAEAAQLRTQNVKISSEILNLKARQGQEQAELNALKSIENVEQSKILAKQKEVDAIQDQINAALAKEAGLRAGIEKTVTATSTKLQAGLSQGFKNALIGVGTIAALEVLPAATGLIAERITKDKQGAQEIEKAMSGALFGALAGSAFGVGGTALGALAGGVGAIISARREAANTAAEQVRIQLEANKAAELELKNFKARQDARKQTAEDISRAEEELLETTDKIEKLEIEINRLGADKAIQFGLLNDKQELQTKLIQQQAQLRIREKADLEESIRFEERRSQIKERQLTIEKALGVQRQAELALAKTFNDVRLVAQVELKFDTKGIALQKQALAQELTEVESRLSELRAESGSGKNQEIKSLEKERIRIRAEDRRLDFDLIAAQLAQAEKTADINRNAAEEQITAWVNASNLVVNSFKSMVSAQLEITKIIERQGEVFRNIIDEEGRLIDRRISETPGQNSFDRESASLGAQRSNLVRQLINAERTFRNQRAQLTSRSIDEIRGEAKSFREALANANRGIGEFAKDVELGDRKIFRALEHQRATLEANVDLAKANIAIELELSNRIVDIRRREIDVLGKSLELQRKRNEADAELGRKLLQAPDAFLKEIQNISTAQKFLSGVRAGDTVGIESRIRSLQGRGAGGFAVLNKVLEGLEAAVKQGLVLNAGFSPEELVQVFSRLQLFSASEVNKTTEGEKTLISTMDTINNTLIQEFERQTSLLLQEAEIQAQLKENSGAQLVIAQAQAATLDRMASDAIKLAGDSRDELRTLASETASKLEGALAKLPTQDTVTAGDRAIVDAILSLNNIMNDIREASPDVRKQRDERKELADVAAKLARAEGLVSARRQASTDTSPFASTSVEDAKAFISGLDFTEKTIRSEISRLESNLKPLATALEQDFFGLQRVDNPATGQLDTVGNALIDTKQRIGELNKLLEKNATERADAVNQLNTLQSIETYMERMTELQKSLNVTLSPIPEIRNAQVNSLKQGLIPDEKLIGEIFSEPAPGPALPDFQALENTFAALFDEMTTLAGQGIGSISGVVSGILNRPDGDAPAFKRKSGHSVTEQEFNDVNEFLRRTLNDLKNSASSGQSPGGPTVPTIPPDVAAAQTQTFRNLETLEKVFASAAALRGGDPLTSRVGPLNEVMNQIFDLPSIEELSKAFRQEETQNPDLLLYLREVGLTTVESVRAAMENFAESKRQSEVLQNAIDGLRETFGDGADGIIDAVHSIKKEVNLGVGNERGKSGITNLEEIMEFIRTQTELLKSEAVKKAAEDAQTIEKSISQAMESATENMVARLGETLKTSSVNVNLPAVNVQLDARIQQQLQGDEFAQQLVAALQGTGLEDKVADIQGVVAKLVKTALDRGENFDGVDVVDFGGGRLS